MSRATSDVTIVVTQRERFSYTKTSLENLYSNTDIPFQLIYVDGNSPKPIQKYLEQQSKLKGFQLIRKDHFLFPNEARNLALPRVNTKYVVFLDNDVEFQKNWLQEMINCAEETGAWLVGPLYCEGPLNPNGPEDDQKIHMAGGMVHFKEIGGNKRIHSGHTLSKQPYGNYKGKLERQATEMIEYHCFLARMDSFDKIGFPDPKLLTLAEHLDICLSVRKFGGEVYFEPKSVVSYVFPPPFAAYDKPYFNFRWADQANLKSLIHFQKKWNLADDDPFIVNFMRFGLKHRLWAHQLPTNQLLAYSPNSTLIKKVINRLQKEYTKRVSKQSRELINQLNRMAQNAELHSLTSANIVR